MSNRLKALREKKAEIIESAEAITAKAESEKRVVLNDEERAAHAGLLTQLESVSKDIGAEELLMLAKAQSATPLSSGLGSPVAGLKARGVFRNFKGDDAYERATRAGHFFLAAIYGVEKSHGWCRENGLEVLFMRDNGSILTRAQSEGVNSGGGFLVPEDVANDIIVLRNSYGIARRLITVIPMGSDSMSTPKQVSGLTMYFPAEGGSITQSGMTWTQVKLTAKKGAILTLISSELDEDSVANIGDIIAGEIGYAMAVGEDGCLFQGDATSTYGGILGLRTIFNNGVGTLAGSVDAASGHDTMAEIDAVDLASAQGKLPQYVYEKGNPAWFCSQTMWANVFERLIGASGGVTKDQASGRTIREYNGYPVVISPNMLAPAAPTTDASDVAMLMFGDLNMSVAMGERRGITIARSVDFKFDTDQIAIRGTERFDINAHNIGDTTNAGSLIALMGE